MMVFLIVLLAFGLRLISLNQSLWLDEATSANVSALNMAQIIQNFSPGDFHPPLYYLILHAWAKVFGGAEVALRALSVLAGVGTVYSAYLIGKEVKDKKTGLVAALLLGGSGLHIYYSQEARMYALSALFVSCLVYLFVKITKKGRAGEWVAFSLTLALSAFTDYLPILIMPVIWVFAWMKKLDRSWWKRFLTSHIILIGTGFVWLPYFLKQITAGLSVKAHSPFWWQILGQTNFKQLILIPTKFVFGRIDMEPNSLQITSVSLVFILLGVLLYKAVKSYKTTTILWFWLFIPLVAAAIISFWIPTLSYFRFLFVLPAFYLLMAVGITNLHKKLFVPALGIFTIFNLVTSGMYLFNSKNHREDWRGLTAFIKAESQGKNSAVVFVAGSQMEAYRYYDKDAKILTSGSVNAEYDQIWLMRYVKDVFDPEDLTRKKVEELGFARAGEFDFNGVVVWRYEK